MTVKKLVERPLKGNSLWAFPCDYTVIDIETNGLSPKTSEILEISALKFRSDKLTDSFSTLIKPTQRINWYITNLTGITDDMVKDAPKISDALSLFYNFIGNDILIGHNINFDINFLYDNLLKHNNIIFTNSFVDTLRIARVALPNLINHKQTTIAQYYKISTDGVHRALKDCEICNACYTELKRELFKGLNN